MDKMEDLRGRAWRRQQKRKPSHRKGSKSPWDRQEKNWKMMYFRKNKIYRAKQLGFPYPFRQAEIHAEWFD